jgi:hypothetical protein
MFARAAIEDFIESELEHDRLDNRLDRFVPAFFAEFPISGIKTTW